MEEKDILNSHLMIAYNELIEEYVIKENTKYTNSLIKIKQRRESEQFRPNNPPPNMPRPPYPEFNYAVFLSRRVYWQLVTTINLYEQLRDLYPNTASTFNSLISQTELLRVTMYNIYRRLSANSFIFGSSDSITLTGNFCDDLQTTYNYVSDMNTNLFYLQRLVDIDDINRQLIITLTVITNQLNTLNSLIEENCQ